MVGGSRRASGGSPRRRVGALAACSRSRPARRAPPRPQTRYSIVHGCYSLAPASGGHGGQAGRRATRRSAARPRPSGCRRPTSGATCFYGRDADFLALDGDAIAPAAEPSDDADWTVSESGDGFTIVNEYAGKALGVARRRAGRGRAPAPPSASSFVEARAAPTTPRSTSARPAGRPPARRAYGEVGGTVDGHMHGMAYEFLGGKAHCGKPFHRFGAPYALRDCPDHEAGDGCAAVLENVLYGNPARCHDPVGWPTFKDWPHHKSLTHEQSYWRWLERAWRGGMRVYVNLFVENRVLCDLYPLKQNSCNEMDSVLLQAKRIREMQDYIDAQAGGPGKGFFRIVRNPVRGAQGDQPGQARGDPGDGGLRAVRLRAREAASRPATTRRSTSWLDRLHDARRAPARDHEQVRQRAHRGRRRRRHAPGRSPTSATSSPSGKFFDLRECNDARVPRPRADRGQLSPQRGPDHRQRARGPAAGRDAAGLSRRAGVQHASGSRPWASTRSAGSSSGG